MNRHPCQAVLFWLILVGSSVAQEGQKDPAPEVAPLLEDVTDLFIANLHNHGLADASIAERDEETVFSGDSSLRVTAFQRFNTQMPGWKFEIAEKPKPGQFRYIRFAWKRTEAPGIMLQLHAASKTWHRYVAGSVNERTQKWGPIKSVAEVPPRQWEVVTRDLFADFGAMTITGISFTALEGPGHAYYDHIYLGRTIKDLDGVTPAGKAEGSPEQPAKGDLRWLTWAMALLLVAGATAVLLVSWLRRKPAGSRPPEHEPAEPVHETAEEGSADRRVIALACSACGKKLRVKEGMTGKQAKCPGCGAKVVIP